MSGQTSNLLSVGCNELTYWPRDVIVNSSFNQKRYSATRFDTESRKQVKLMTGELSIAGLLQESDG